MQSMESPAMPMGPAVPAAPATPAAIAAPETPSDIDSYIAAQPENVQPILKDIRKTIRSAAPDATEKISWRMPTFWQGENLIHFAAFKKHVGIYPGGEATTEFANRLTGYKTSKGAIQFPLDKPVDHELIADIVRWRVEQTTRP